MEQNAAHRYLREFNHFIRWQQMFLNVVVIPHQTQQNKNDPELGIESVIPSAYKQGMKDLPKKPHDIDSFNYMKVKVKELTTYVTGQLSAVAKKRIGFDTVDADWMGVEPAEGDRDRSPAIGHERPPEPGDRGPAGVPPQPGNDPALREDGVNGEVSP